MTTHTSDMCACVRLLLLAALPALAGVGCEVVSVGAAGPAFAAQRLQYVAALGEPVALDCKVMRLGDKAVSWVRSRDLQILSHAGAVFTSDARVSASATRGSLSRHTLRIDSVRTADAGRYECQLNTEPKMSLFFNLTVLEEPLPVAVIRAVSAGVRGAAGGAATLACEARYEPPPPHALELEPFDIRWSKDGQILDLQSGRGSMSLDTQRWEWRAVSRLTLGALRPHDAGRYRCALPRGPAATLALTVTEDALSPVEAMQRDETSVLGSSAPASLTRLTPLALLLLSIHTIT